jgi:hypothetical protein
MGIHMSATQRGLRAFGKVCLGVAFAALSALTVMNSQQALAGDQDFVIVNKTGYDISEVYVSPAKSANWEEDILGRDILPEGDRTEITFSRSEDPCRWDLKVVYADDDSSAEWGALNLCEISVVTLKYNRAKDETSAVIE